MDKYQKACEDCGSQYPEWKGAVIKIRWKNGDYGRVEVCDFCIAAFLEELDSPPKRVKAPRKRVRVQ